MKQKSKHCASETLFKARICEGLAYPVYAEILVTRITALGTMTTFLVILSLIVIRSKQASSE